MKRLILAVGLLALLACPALATDSTNEGRQIKNKTCGAATDVIQIDDQGHIILARRGCCSWHSGVCGCRNGRVVCCDGSLSPTCTCRAESPSGESGLPQ